MSFVPRVASRNNIRLGTQEGRRPGIGRLGIRVPVRPRKFDGRSSRRFRPGALPAFLPSCFPNSLLGVGSCRKAQQIPPTSATRAHPYYGQFSSAQARPPRTEPSRPGRGGSRRAERAIGSPGGSPWAHEKLGRGRCLLPAGFVARRAAAPASRAAHEEPTTPQKLAPSPSGEGWGEGRRSPRAL